MVVGFSWASGATADTRYHQRVFFDNSLTPDQYFESSGKASLPSSLDLRDGKLPVDTQNFFTGPNALRLEWASRHGGSWEAEIRVQEWRNREIYFPGTFLYFWCYSATEMKSGQLPLLVLRDRDRNFTAPLNLAANVQSIPAGKWVQIKIPLDHFSTASIRNFQPHRVSTLVFVQGLADEAKHTLLIDEIGIGNDHAAAAGSMPKVRNLRAQGYERHIGLSWDPVDDQNLGRYVITRSMNGGPFRRIGIQVPGVHRYSDFLGKLNTRARYTVTAEDISYGSGSASAPADASTSSKLFSDDELLSMLQEAAFLYYWDGAHPVAGMARENLPGDDDIVATGASGFGIMALVVGVDRGFITREQGRQRLLEICAFLQKADRYHGAWPHFLNGTTGRRMPVFDMYDNGADLVETSFLMEGLLAARQYFRGERELYEQITALWNAVEWDWFRRTPDGKALYWHWSPEYTWHIDHPLTGWNEVMVTYLLGIASASHSVPASLYYSGWASVPKEYISGKTWYGIKLDVGIGSGGPLFFTQYSYLGFDPHVRDRFTNYFENNRKLVLINYAYCQQNPHGFKGYGPNVWGITAVDGPDGYVPYEPDAKSDDGTIAPTGAMGSFPYTPEHSMAALKYFYRELGDRLWDVYGFRDAFNLQRNWFSRINMGLNQAPMVVMIENYRTGLLWKNFMANPEIQSMLARVGFKVDQPAK
jgi:exo beta-1,2-glucooligosaccharide sophorohydrolase (non-reducing end)